jgi:phosphatidylserine/phosphatidylglycerophosphate/cardiolipin synthase-like enzyme
MPSLSELKAKWFIDVTSGGQFPPQTRHPGTQVQPFTDGNLVEPLIEGATVMADFHQRVEKMITAPDPTQHELWFASWQLDAVKLLGATKPEKDAKAKILDAAQAGVKVYYLGSGHILSDGNAQSFAKQLNAKGGHGASDKRFKRWASHHQKFYVFRGPANDWTAIVGSVDLSFARWDTSDHLDSHPDRPEKGGPTHDVAVSVKGPAVHDIALTFAERWNDTTNRNRTTPAITTTIPTTFLTTPILAAGNHSVQVLRTYGISSGRGYAWSGTGEFTAWAAALNAIKRATRYIYIEDQYFYTFNHPPAVDAPAGQFRDSDLVYQLGEALKRGVDVVVLLSASPDDPVVTHYQMHQRGISAHYLSDISLTPGAGDYVMCSLRVGTKNPIIHSKLMIVDDEFVLVGSANVGQRSMTTDSELHLGIVDGANTFARNLRLTLWREHMELTDDSPILDPAVGADLFQTTANGGQGRLRVYPQSNPGTAPCCHTDIMTYGVEPYGGPARSGEL